MAPNSDEYLQSIPLVDIDEGRFKYILVKVYCSDSDKSNEKENSITIVRGYANCLWHADIYERLDLSREGLHVDTECLGGGRIEHYPEKRLIKVYGYSQGFGKADHSVTKTILLQKYSDYEIEISDAGY